MSPAAGNKAPQKAPNGNRDATDRALIAAGLELFGEYGFNGTSTRMLSQSSGANVSAIAYYFGNKEGLYKAVIEHIVQRATQYIGPACEAIREKEPMLTKLSARKALKTLVESVAHLFVDSDEPKSWALIVMREQARPTEAFDILYYGMMKTLHGQISALIGICTGLPAQGDEAKIRAHTFLGQILVFLSSRETLIRQLGVKKLSDHHVSLIHKVLWAQVAAALKVPMLCRGEDR